MQIEKVPESSVEKDVAKISCQEMKQFLTTIHSRLKGLNYAQEPVFKAVRYVLSVIYLSTDASVIEESLNFANKILSMDSRKIIHDQYLQLCVALLSDQSSRSTVPITDRLLDIMRLSVNKSPISFANFTRALRVLKCYDQLARIYNRMSDMMNPKRIKAHLDNFNFLIDNLEKIDFEVKIMFIESYKDSIGQLIPRFYSSVLSSVCQGLKSLDIRDKMTCLGLVESMREHITHETILLMLDNKETVSVSSSARETEVQQMRASLLNCLEFNDAVVRQKGLSILSSYVYSAPQEFLLKVQQLLFFFYNDESGEVRISAMELDYRTKKLLKFKLRVPNHSFISDKIYHYDYLILDEDVRVRCLIAKIVSLHEYSPTEKGTVILKVFEILQKFISSLGVQKDQTVYAFRLVNKFMSRLSVSDLESIQKKCERELVEYLYFQADYDPCVNHVLYSFAFKIRNTLGRPISFEEDIQHITDSLRFSSMDISGFSQYEPFNRVDLEAYYMDRRDILPIIDRYTFSDILVATWELHGDILTSAKLWTKDSAINFGIMRYLWYDTQRMDRLRAYIISRFIERDSIATVHLQKVMTLTISFCDRLKNQLGMSYDPQHNIKDKRMEIEEVVDTTQMEQLFASLDKGLHIAQTDLINSKIKSVRLCSPNTDIPYIEGLSKLIELSLTANYRLPKELSFIVNGRLIKIKADEVPLHVSWNFNVLLEPSIMEEQTLTISLVEQMTVGIYVPISNRLILKVYHKYID